MRQENEPNLIWALSCLKNILSPSTTPSVVLTDRDLALMSAISVLFPDVAHLLCTWHISKNVKGGHGKKTFEKNEDWDAFFIYFMN